MADVDESDAGNMEEEQYRDFMFDLAIRVLSTVEEADEEEEEEPVEEVYMSDDITDLLDDDDVKTNDSKMEEGEEEKKDSSGALVPSTASASASKIPTSANYYIALEPPRTNRLPHILTHPRKPKVNRNAPLSSKRKLKARSSSQDGGDEEEDEAMSEQEMKDKKTKLMAEEELKRLTAYMQTLDRKNGLSIDLQICLLDCQDDIKVELMTKHKELMNSPMNEKSKLQSWLTLALSLPYQRQAQLPFTIKSPLSDMSTCAYLQEQHQAIGTYLRGVMQRLDAAVFGHQQAKKDIVSFIASLVRRSMKKQPTPQVSGGSSSSDMAAAPLIQSKSSRALAICGPAGVGKTTLAHTIADVLGLPFQAINCGGLTDPHSLMGHNFTYSNSRPGKIAKAMSQAAASNVVFYFDEVDKIGTDKSEEMLGVLTHILDVEQNHRFMDNYLDPIPLDLSNALFILSFNDANKIDDITKDRMKIIHVKDFTSAEKLVITKEFILPGLYQAMHFHPMEVALSEDVVQELVRRYEGQSGLRHIRRAALEILERWNLYHLLHQEEYVQIEENVIYITWADVEQHHLLDHSTQKDTSSYEHMYL